MTSDQRKFEHLAGSCDSLAQSASTPEQREAIVDLAHKWQAIATSQKLMRFLSPLIVPRSKRGCTDSVVRPRS